MKFLRVLKNPGHKALLVISILASCVSPRTINDIEKFDPEFKVGDYRGGQITGKDGFVACSDPQFNNYLCMHIEKAKEMKRIMSRYRRVPRLKSLPINDDINAIIRDYEQSNQ